MACPVNTFNEWDPLEEIIVGVVEDALIPPCPEGGRHRVCVRVGEPAPTIVREAQAGRAEVIVQSCNGSFAAGHGAVVRALLELALCPPLVVPAG